jgi:hypothetical protein
MKHVQQAEVGMNSTYSLYVSVGQTKAMPTTFLDKVRTKSMEPHSD